jgi:DNA-binding NarL/FixJ family response regulator
MSPRHVQILTGLSEGQSMKEVAAQLGIAPTTVSSHLAYLRLRHQAKSTTHLVARWLCKEIV